MKKIINFYFRHKKSALIVLCLCAVVMIFGGAGTAHAADAAPAGSGVSAPADEKKEPVLVKIADSDPDMTELMKDINEGVNIMIRFASALLWPVLLMIGSLLDNDLVFGGAMGERLLGIWVQMRNLVNIAFVLVLLAIALYNVLGLGEEGGGPLALKQALPKFVLALIAVNFSFLAIKVVLDFTNVITGAVFALPATVGTSYSSAEVENMICGTISNEAPMKTLWCEEGKFNERAVAFFNRLDRTNITVIYAIKFGKAPSLKFIKDGLKSLGQLGFNILFNLVLYVVYALSFIVLFLVLLARVVVLWVAVVLSPFLALSIVVPQLKELAGESGELQKKVMKSVIAPITIGLFLSVGFIMLDGFAADKGLHGNLLSSNTMEAIDINALPTDITDLQQLMIAVALVVIVWMGVFSAASGTVAGTVTDMIKSKAQDFGKFAAKLPTYLQVIPTGGKFGRESATVAEVLATFKDIPGTIARERGGSLLSGAGRPSEADMKPWKDVRLKPDNINQLAKAIAQSPHGLKDTEGLGIFRESIMAINKWDPKNPEDQKRFEKEYGTDYRSAVNGIAGNRDLMRAIEKEDVRLNSREKLMEAVEKGKAKSAEEEKKEGPPTPPGTAASSSEPGRGPLPDTAGGAAAGGAAGGGAAGGGAAGGGAAGGAAGGGAAGGGAAGGAPAAAAPAGAAAGGAAGGGAAAGGAPAAPAPGAPAGGPVP